MKRIRLAGLTCLLGALVMPAARASEPTPLARDAVSFLFEFCGSVLGAERAELDKAGKALAVGTLFPAEPVSAQSPTFRDAVVNALGISNDTPVHRITFKKTTPRVLAVAYVRTDLKTCMVGVVGHSDALERILEFTSPAGSGWQEIYGARDTRNWQRARRDGRVLTLTVLGGDSSVTMGMDASLPLFPTIQEFDAFADSLRDPCVRSAATNSKPDAAPFARAFEAPRQNPDGSILLESKNDIPGGRLILLPASQGSGCLFAINKADAKVPYQQAFAASFMRLPGATNIEPPSETWLYTDADTKRDVAMAMDVEDDVLVIAFVYAPPEGDTKSK